MRIVEYLAPFLGGWQGVNRMRMLPTDEFRDSAASAAVSVTAQGFVTVAYTWTDGDQPQDGVLLLGGATDDGGASAVWADSWHSPSAWMNLAGTVGDDGVLRLIGSYPAPSGPDWGWQVHVDPGNGAGGRISMHNVVPGEAPYEVVDARYDLRT